MKKLLVLASLLLAGCEVPANKPHLDIKADSLRDDDHLKITIEYNGKQPVTAEVNGEMVAPP